MHITQLTATNVKRLTAVSITPEGNVVIVGGNNGQGKTSLLDSIWMALGGRKAICDKPIRKGAKRANIKLELSNGLVVRLNITSKGTSLVVKNGKGSTLSSPQAILDKLAGTLTFDPLAFTKMPPVKQRDILRLLVGLDFSEIEAERKAIYDERTKINQEAGFLAGRLTGMPAYPGLPHEEISVAALVAQLKEIEEAQAAIVSAKGVLDGVEARLEDCRAEINEASKQVLHWQTMLATAQKTASELETQQSVRAENVVAREGALADGDAIRQQITDAEQVNGQVKANAARAALDADHDELIKASSTKTTAINGLDEQKAGLLADATFPVPGLSFDEDGIMFQDVPFAQCSSAEQLRVSVAMGMASNPELKIMLIRDGSLLDSNSMEVLAKMAADHKYQVWLERVGDKDDCQVVIEDGAVKEPTDG